MIRLTDVSFGYGRTAVLKDVSLEIPSGVFMAFIGPNGAGKTTLLRGILGLVKPLAGTVETPFAHAPAGYVPQQKSIDPLFPLTVSDIVAMGLYPKLGLWKTPGAEEKKEIAGALAELGLEPYARKNYRELSGGTRQKVLIARALASQAEVFVLDEPTSELDEPSEQEVFNHLRRFVKDHHKTVLMAHHGLSHLIRSQAEDACLVSHGKVRMAKTAQIRSGFEF